MSASAFETLLAQFATALASDGLQVDRSPLDVSEDPARCPRLIVRRGRSEQVAAAFMNRVDWTQSVIVNGLVAGANWETQADALHMRANGLIQADPVLAAAGAQCVEIALMGRGAADTVGEFVARYTVNVLTNLQLESIE